MSDETKIDWTEATDEQLAQASAEAKTRRPLTDFEGQNWADMSHREFLVKSGEVLKAQRDHAEEQRILKEHSELVAEKEARERRKKGEASADA